MAEDQGVTMSVYWAHESIHTLLWMWVSKVDRQWHLAEVARVEPDMGDDEVIDLDYEIEAIDGVLRQLEPLIGA